MIFPICHFLISFKNHIYQIPAKIVILGLCLSLFIIACDEKKDCAICPDLELVSDYNIYIGLFGSNQGVYIYNTRRMNIVDSILGLPEHDNIEVTIGEEYLVGSKATGGSSTWVVDLSTGVKVKEFAYYGKVEISPNGEYIAIQTPQRIRILNAQSLDEIVIDSIVVGGGHFDIEGNTFFGISTGNVIVQIDIANDSILASIPWIPPNPFGGNVGKVLPTNDKNKLYLWVRYGTLSSIIYAYYLLNDSNKMVYNIGSENVDLELTPDKKKLIFTDPFNFDNPTQANIYIAEVENDHVEAIVPSPFIRNPVSQNRLNSSEIAFTPDGKYCLFASVESQWQGLLDVNSRKYVNWFRIDSTSSGTYGRSVACRRTIK